MIPYNLTSTHIWPAVESALTRAPGRMSLSSRLALYNVAWGTTGFIAFFTRGALEHIHWSMIFVVPALVSALSFFLLLFWGIPSAMIGKDHVPDDAAGEHELDAPGMRDRARTLLLMAWIGNALAYVAINVLIPLLAKLADESGVASLVSSGMITSAWSFTRSLGFAITWLWAGWHYKSRWLIGAKFLLTASFCLMLTTHIAPLFVAMQLLFGFATALFYASSLYYAMHVSSGHGKHAGMHEALIGVGIALGPAIGALAGAGEMGSAAIGRIGIGVSTILLLGALSLCLLPLRFRRNPDPNTQA
jgi:MFS family permease